MEGAAGDMRAESRRYRQRGRAGQSQENRYSQRRRRTKPQAEDKDSLEWLADRVQVPAEVLGGAPVFFFYGQHQLWVENYKSILEYQDTIIRIQTKQGRVKICGKALGIDEFAKDGMRITGWIKCVEFYGG